MNFSTLKGLTIPEGNVTQITDVNGNVLWKQAPSGATVTITLNAGYEKDLILIDGVYYGRQNAELTVPIGTVITVKGATTIYLNNIHQSFGGDYNYTVIGNVGIHCSGTKPNPYYTVYVVSINEP